MRELKFRGWDKLEKRFVPAEFFDQIYLRMDGEVVWWSAVKGFEDASNMIEVSQNTGLRDKTGVDIYEGDITELDGGGRLARGEIFFDDGCFLFKGDWIKEPLTYPELKYYVGMDFCALEIIGNIYENSELLA